MTNSEPTPEDFSFALTSEAGEVLYGRRPDGTEYRNPGWKPFGKIAAVADAWQGATDAQQSNVGAACPALAEALDRLVQP